MWRARRRDFAAFSVRMAHRMCHSAPRRRAPAVAFDHRPTANLQPCRPSSFFEKKKFQKKKKTKKQKKKIMFSSIHTSNTRAIH
jgi:hypothetical protein